MITSLYSNFFIIIDIQSTMHMLPTLDHFIIVSDSLSFYYQSTGTGPI